MQENTFGRGGLVRRPRRARRLLGVAVLAVPVVAGLGFAYGLQNPADGNRAAAAAPADSVRLASSSGEKDDAAAPVATRSRAAAPAKKSGQEKSGQEKPRHEKSGQEESGAGASLQDETGEEELTDAQRLAENSRAGGGPVTPRAPSAAEEKAVAAFLDAGFDTGDAALLSTLYGFPGDVTRAEVRAGTTLLAGGELPIEHGQIAWTVSMDAARATFYNNGYDDEDAVRLAAMWGAVDPAEATTFAGQRLLAGVPLSADV